MTEKLFEQEATYEEWKENLHICQVDLFYPEELIQFLEKFKREYKRVDIIINAATFAFETDLTTIKIQECELNDAKEQTQVKLPDNSFYKAELVNVTAPFTIINELSSLLKVRYPVYALDDSMYPRTEEQEEEKMEENQQEERNISDYNCPVPDLQEES